MTDALQLVEGGVRQRRAFPANLQPPIRKVIDIDHFATKANRYAVRLKRQLHTTVVHHQLVRHLTLLAPAQDLIQILPGIEQTVEIFVASWELGKATVVVGDEAGQKRVCRLGRAPVIPIPSGLGARAALPHDGLTDENFPMNSQSQVVLAPNPTCGNWARRTVRAASTAASATDNAWSRRRPCLPKSDTR